MSRFGDHLVHDHLDLEVRRGEVLGLVGGSGAGKSVLLSTLIGLRTPDGGTVEVLGVDLARATDAQWEALERSWGVLFQSGALFSALDVRDNVASPIREHARLPRDLADRLAELKIALAGLPPEAADLKPAELSGGMRKRAGLARAIALDPELLFLDEPTAGLDPIGAEQFDKLILDLSQGLGFTVLMITPRPRQSLCGVRPRGGDRRQEDRRPGPARRAGTLRTPLDPRILRRPARAGGGRGDRARAPRPHLPRRWRRCRWSATRTTPWSG